MCMVLSSFNSYRWSTCWLSWRGGNCNRGKEQRCNLPRAVGPCQQRANVVFPAAARVPHLTVESSLHATAICTKANYMPSSLPSRVLKRRTHEEERKRKTVRRWYKICLNSKYSWNIFANIYADRHSLFPSACNAKTAAAKCLTVLKTWSSFRKSTLHLKCLWGGSFTVQDFFFLHVHEIRWPKVKSMQDHMVSSACTEGILTMLYENYKWNF